MPTVPNFELAWHCFISASFLQDSFITKTTPPWNDQRQLECARLLNHNLQFFYTNLQLIYIIYKLTLTSCLTTRFFRMRMVVVVVVIKVYLMIPTKFQIMLRSPGQNPEIIKKWAGQKKQKNSKKVRTKFPTNHLVFFSFGILSIGILSANQHSIPSPFKLMNAFYSSH